MNDPLGSHGEPAPPRIAERLLARLVPSGVAGASIVGDAREEFHERLMTGSRLSARLWYWRHVLSLTRHFLRTPRPPGPAAPRVPRTRRAVTRAALFDLAQSVRAMKSRPGFTIVVVLTLAVGIGATTAMFGAVHAALLSRLPFDEADRLVIGRATFGGEINPWVSGYDYYDYRDQSRSFESLSAFFFSGRVTIVGDDEPERVTTAYATWDFFHTLRVEPALGRWFSPDEAVRGGPNVAIISYGFWQRRFGGATDTAGRALVINGVPCTVVGVLPARFHFMDDADVWRLTYRDGPGAEARRWHNLLLVGRLKPGVTVAGAQAEIDVISRRLEAEYPETNDGKALRVTDLHEALAEGVHRSLLMLMAAVSLVLLLACSNAAGLLLARGQTRLTEIAVRSAMGASRWRLVRQLMTESLLIALLAGLLGVGLAAALQRLVIRLLPMGQLGITQPSLAMPVLFFALATSIATGILFGIVPALAGTTVDVSRQLKAGSRTSATKGSTFARSALVVLQVAISVVLLVGSGLLIRSLGAQMHVDLGFDPANVLTADLRLPADAYATPARRVAFFRGLLDEVQALPGVVSVATVNRLPILNPSGNIYVYPAAVPAEAARQSTVSRSADFRVVTPGYFATMRIPLVAGRDIAATDTDAAPRVMVVSESLARLFFGDSNPLGRRLRVDMGELVEHEVVGVVADARLSSITTEPREAMYMPYGQNTQNQMRLVVRSQGYPAGLIAPIRDLLRAKDRNVPLAEPATMQSIVDDALADYRVVTSSLGLMAGVAVLLALMGLYGVLAYYVSQRHREMGLRIALGATAADVIGLVLRHGIALVAAGLLLGIGGALAVTRLLQQMLYGVQATDPTTFAGVAVFLVVVTLAACLLPAWRATRADPVETLRAE